MNESTTSTKLEDKTNDLIRETYELVHAKRYAESLAWITTLANAAEKILDLGGESPFSLTLQRLWPGKLVPYYGGDLSQGFVIRDCDLILCMECLEHVADCESAQLQTEWKGSGTHMVLASCWLSLRPGGHLFITTPNPCSITAIHHALNLAPPMMYRPHVREYAPFELDEMVRGIGFEILRRETLDVWLNAISAKDHDTISDFIRKAKYPTELRGEDLFVLAKRPMKVKT